MKTFNNYKEIPALKDRSNFIPFKGWENYNQSKLLPDLSISQRKTIEHKTGIVLPEGTKGFPLELLYFMWQDHEFFLDDAFDTSISQKMYIGAKGTLKTGFDIMFMLFMQANFDFALLVSMMKYQNQLYQVLENVKGYIDLIKQKTGLDIRHMWELPEKLDEKAADIRFDRVWKVREEYRNAKGELKVRIKRVLVRPWRLRSFDRPNKIANTPKPIRNGCYVVVCIIEPQMFDDPGDVSAEKMMDTWMVNKSSLFRYARELKIYSQMLTEMNIWDEYHDFTLVADKIIPYNLEEMQNKLMLHAINLEDNWSVRRLTRKSNTMVPLEGDELRDSKIMEVQNHNLYLATFWGAPMSNFGSTPYTYLASIDDSKLLWVNETPSVEQLIEIDNKDVLHENGYTIGLGVDWGINDATELKLSTWIPSMRKIVRSHLYELNNGVRKKEGLTTLDPAIIFEQLAEALSAWLVPFVKRGVYSKTNRCILFWDGGSPSEGKLFDAYLVQIGLGDIVEVVLTKRHGKDGIKEKIGFDNYAFAKGILCYDVNNGEEYYQYKKSKNKMKDMEVREEKNQPLDHIDARNIAEWEIRTLVQQYEYNRIERIGRS